MNLAKQSGVSKKNTAQREVVAVEEQQKLVKKSLEIQVEEKQVAEIKNKVQTVKNSLEVTNSSIKQTHNIRVTIDTHPAEMNDVSVERTEPKHRD